MTQYRITTQRANVREEADITSRPAAVLNEGAILHVDSDRRPEGDWLPVLFARGWVHRSVVETVEDGPE